MDTYHRTYGDHNEIELTFYNDPDDLSTLKTITGVFEDGARIALIEGDIFLGRDMLGYSCHIQELMDAMKALADEREKGEEESE